MTREEAKDVFLNRGYVKVNGGEIFDGDKWRQSVVVISEWLEQEPCEDCISRESIKQKLQEHHDFFVNAYGGFSNLPQNDKSRVDEITNCIAIVVNEPPVSPQQRGGRWIRVNKDKLKCSKCEVIHFIAQYPQSAQINYCPNCGCRMKGEDE